MSIFALGSVWMKLQQVAYGCICNRYKTLPKPQCYLCRKGYSCLDLTNCVLKARAPCTYTVLHCQKLVQQFGPADSWHVFLACAAPHPQKARQPAVARHKPSFLGVSAPSLAAAVKH